MPPDSAGILNLGFTENVVVTIPSDMSHSGKAYSRAVPIDKCIADIVQALADAGIIMRSACCGHRKKSGNILLEDGRTLRIDKK